MTADEYDVAAAIRQAHNTTSDPYIRILCTTPGDVCRVGFQALPYKSTEWLYCVNELELPSPTGLSPHEYYIRLQDTGHDGLAIAFMCSVSYVNQ